MPTATGSGFRILATTAIPSLANTFGAILLGTFIGFMCVIRDLCSSSCSRFSTDFDAYSLPGPAQAVWFDAASDVPVLSYVPYGHSAVEDAGTSPAAGVRMRCAFLWLTCLFAQVAVLLYVSCIHADPHSVALTCAAASRTRCIPFNVYICGLWNRLCYSGGFALILKRLLATTISSRTISDMRFCFTACGETFCVASRDERAIIGRLADSSCLQVHPSECGNFLVRCVGVWCHGLTADLPSFSFQ